MVARGRRSGTVCTWVFRVMVAGLTLNGETVVAQSVDVGEGVSWALAEHRAETVSDIRYAYRLSVPCLLYTSDAADE